MKKRMKRIGCLLIALSFMLTACGGGNGNGNGEAVSDSGKEEKMIIHTSNGPEPGSLDPALATGTHESWALNHLYTGLLSYDKEGKLIDGMAEMPEVSEDGMVYTFHIKDDVKWSNGDPVTAEDFAYEWIRVLTPETASKYAYQLYYVKGGEAYNSVEVPGIYYEKDDKGKDTDVVDHIVEYTDKDLEGLDIDGKSEKEINNMVYEKWLAEAKENVGVKVIDDKTLEVTLENPTPYFADITAFYTLFPINSKVAKENPDWANSGETYVSNGAFVLNKWDHDSVIELSKNDNWYKADDVKLDGIILDILEDKNTAWQNYDSGEYQMLVETPQEVVAQKSTEKDPELKIGNQVGTYYYNLNVIPRKDGVNPFTNKNIRLALSMALDRDAIVNNISKGGQIAAQGMVPFGLMDDQGKEFRDDIGNLIEYNPEKAKELFAKGMEEEGITPEDMNGMILLYNTDENHKKLAQAVQQLWKESLGFEIGLENVEFKVKLAREDVHDFEISRAGWVGDYADPMTMLDLFVTNGSMNHAGYSNPEYDALIKTAKETGDQKVRMNAMKEAEKILIADMPVIPVYFYTQPYFVKSNVKGIYKPLLQYPVLTYAEIVEE